MVFSTTYPDHIDSDEDVNGVVVWDVLEHAHVGIKAHFSGHLIKYRDFVDAQGSLQYTQQTQLLNVFSILVGYS